VEAGHAHVDSAPEEFAATMEYGSRRYGSADEFLAAHDERWVREQHEAYSELLDRGRTVLGVGSGEGEHEVLLMRAGFDMVASDVVPGSLDAAQSLFPGLRVTEFDVLAPTAVACDDVLVSGIDFYFGDDDVVRMLEGLRALVEPDGRIVFTLRYRANAATWLIDRVILPVVAARRRRGGETLVRKHHGYRRSPRDIRRLAQRAGLRVGRVRHAGFGMELARLRPVPGWVVSADHRLRLLSSSVALELLRPSGRPGSRPASRGRPGRSRGWPGD